MKKNENYNSLHAAALALTGVLGLTAVTACTPEIEPRWPSTVFVQQVGGRIFLQGCFTGFGNENIEFDEVGTLKLKSEPSDKWKFTFVTGDKEHSRDINISQLGMAKIHDLGPDTVYNVPDKDKNSKNKDGEIKHRITCKQELLGNKLPEYARNQFATTVIRNGSGFVEHAIGPINSKTHLVPNTTAGLGEHFTPVGNQQIPVERLVP
jgi:hypothetical protein